MSTGIAYGGRRPLKEPGRSLTVSALSPLKNRIFLAIWLASLVSNLGTWMQNVGAAWLMTSLSTSPLMVSVLQSAASLPIVVLALPAGALADIIDRRKLLLISQALMLVAAGVLGVLTILKLTTPYSLLGLTFALGAGAAMNAPAWQAIVPELAPREELGSALALSGINFNFARALGPALGGFVVSLGGAGANFILNAASFLAVIVVLYAWRRPKRESVLPAERVIGAMRAGLRYARHAVPLRTVLIRVGVLIIGSSAMWAVLPLVARYQLGMNATGYGILLGFFGAGAVGGGMLLPYLEQRHSRDMIAASSTVLLAAEFATLAMVRNIPAVYAAMFIGGGAWICAMTEFNVSAQLAVPEWVRGRALACYQVVLQGGIAMGSAIWGAVAQHLSVPDSLLLAAAVCLAGIPFVFPFRLARAEGLELGQAPPSPVPELAGELDPESGPVLVSVEYLIDPRRAPEFQALMQGVRGIRRRDGAIFWGMFFDATQPGRFVEYFVVETWAEHVRQHSRATLDDLELIKRVRSFHIGENDPNVTHQISAQVITRGGAIIFPAYVPPSGSVEP
ncbi:MAG: MFS transporter [Candidatus Binataceae bacterium]